MDVAGLIEQMTDPKRPLFRRPGDQKRMWDQYLGLPIIAVGLYVMVTQEAHWEAVTIVALGVGFLQRQLVVDMIRAWKGRAAEEDDAPPS